MPAILTREESEALGRRVLGMLTATGAQVEIRSSTSASTEFARGDAHLAAESATASVAVLAQFQGRHSFVQTNRLDDTGIGALVREAEALAREHRSPREQALLPPQVYPQGPQIYFDSVAQAQAAGVAAGVFRQAAEAAEAAGLVVAGDLVLEASSRAVLNTERLTAYERSSYGEFSLTARTVHRRGSGWAWCGHEDWARVSVDDVIARALDLARRAVDPVAVEPGRYTVILEPPAVAALVSSILTEWSARLADAGQTVFSKEPLGTNKIGLQMIDRRLGMVSDPWDEERPASTIGPYWTPIPGRVAWFEQGILRNLEYDPDYARDNRRAPVINPGGVRLAAEGAPASLEEMIAATKRGVWVNRLSHVATMNARNLLLTGTTRDGTFLIENGKITKAIKNFRFTESPFFAFNKLEAWGEPVRASRGVVAPRLKLRDFDFTSLTDAI